MNLSQDVEQSISRNTWTEQTVSEVAGKYRSVFDGMLNQVEMSELFGGKLDKGPQYAPTWNKFANDFVALQDGFTKSLDAKTPAEQKRMVNFYAQVAKKCFDAGDLATCNIIFFGILKYEELLDKKGSEAFLPVRAVISSPMKTSGTINAFGANATRPPNILSNHLLKLGEVGTRNEAGTIINSNKLENQMKILTPVFTARQSAVSSIVGQPAPPPEQSPAPLPPPFITEVEGQTVSAPKKKVIDQGTAANWMREINSSPFAPSKKVSDAVYIAPEKYTAASKIIDKIKADLSKRENPKLSDDDLAELQKIDSQGASIQKMQKNLKTIQDIVDRNS